MRYYLKLMRWPNLLIVALTMYLLQYQFLFPVYEVFQVTPPLSYFSFSLLVLMTVLATAAGYVINDWFDYAIDVINKPERVIINKRITWRTARQLYFALMIGGALLASHLSARTGLWGIILLYNLVTILLYLYARYFKRMPLIGNIVVALLCALVTGLVWYVNLFTINALAAQNAHAFNYLHLTLTAYFGFSYFITMYREIVKDLEDETGDRAVGARTLPIIFGSKISKIIAAVFASIVLLGLILFINFSIGNSPSPLQRIPEIALLTIVLLSVLMLFRANKKEDFSRLSQLLKFTILMGLFWFLF